MIYLLAFTTCFSVIAAWKKSRKYRNRVESLETPLKKDQVKRERKAAAVKRFEQNQE